ncbi:MAG TPA: hypothetical protein VI792_01930 [Candidatus Eisenbacteria bacterium]
MLRSRPARLLALSSLVLLALAAGRAGAAAPAGRNLLDNPGFEQPLGNHPWMPAAWDTSVSGLMSVFFGRDTFMVHSGRYSVTIANLSTRYPMAHNWSQGLLVDRSWWGKDAVFSMWTRSNGLQGRAFVRAAVYRDSISKMAKIWGMSRSRAADSLNIKVVDDPMLELGWRYAYFVDAETDWVRREVRLYIPPTTNFLRLSAGLSGTGQVLYDDASLTLEPAQPAAALKPHVNLLADPGFEGDGTAWEYSMPPFEGVHVDRDTTLAHTGRACIHMEDEGQGLNLTATGACQAIVNRSLSGKRVRVTGWIKTDSLRGIANVAVFFKTLHGPEHPVPTLYSNTHDWMQISVEGDAPPDTYEAWVWFMYQSPAAGRVYFDDCSFEVLGPASKPPPPPHKSASAPPKKTSKKP